MSPDPAQRTRAQNFWLIVVLGFLNALTPFSIDMYLPSVPQIAGELGIPVGQMALTVSVYFIGFALGQIIYGPLLDRFGRKGPMYFGLALYVAASVGCLTSTSFTQLLGWRVLSALGGCAASVGTVTMVRDLFPREAGTRVFSMLMLVLSVSPLLAPAAGSLVVTVAGWRAIFAILAVVGLIDLLLIYFYVPVGYQPDPSVELKPGPILSRFREILRLPAFSVYVIAGSLAFAGLFVYVAGSPAIFMEGFGVSAQVYGMIFALLATGMIGGGQLNLLLLKRFGERTIFRSALILETVFALILLTGTLTGWCGLFSTIALLFATLTCAGLTYPNAASLALGSIEKNIGSASALMGFLQLGIGAVTSAGVGMLAIKGALPTAMTITFASTLGLLILAFFGRFVRAR